MNNVISGEKEGIFLDKIDKKIQNACIAQMTVR